MPDEHRRPAGRAELTVAVLGPLVEAELVRAFRHLDVRRRPQARRVDRRAEPATAGATVAVHLKRRVASDLELDRAAGAAGLVCVRHGMSPSTAFEPTQPSSDETSCRVPGREWRPAGGLAEAEPRSSSRAD